MSSVDRFNEMMGISDSKKGQFSRGNSDISALNLTAVGKDRKSKTFSRGNSKKLKMDDLKELAKENKDSPSKAKRLSNASVSTGVTEPMFKKN